MYRTIDAAFWTDPEVRRLSLAEKGMFLYFITNPHTHVSGIYILSRETMATEMGCRKRDVEYGIDTLSKAGFCRFDHEKSVVWVRNMFEYQGAGDKTIRSAAYHLVEDLHKSRLIIEFCDRYPRVREFLPKDFLDTVSIGYLEKSGRATPDTRSLIPDPRSLTPDSRILNPESRDLIPEAPAESSVRVYGRYGWVRLTDQQYERLKEALSGYTDGLIAEFDGWVQEAPDAKHNGVKRRDRDAEASIRNWYRRKVSEGKIIPKGEHKDNADPNLRAAKDFIDRRIKATMAKTTTQGEI